MIFLYVGIGGFLGAISRFLISGFVQKFFGISFPVGTLAVNVFGSFLIGFLAMLFENIIAPEWKAVFITGFLGALTTFSTFSYETVILIQEGLYQKAFLNVFLNVILCLVATISGMTLFKLMFKV
ncbi:CrcB-like protein [Desulfurobacterium thermolithotrophum DSM 11699]|uniref:Fluoride-specific ion channel FluC n=1 Tax=Desulfurobacterium thermolithotrophum (strain DSM 11699 / BSA) TaxID=868864 RepID=F0S0U4_DESTD|nr:fluoride efflux transporter CrcB [Desulfurobacterium thermolithotrophum]ADY72748.1 CrcB-like protein [Desulfurobacterium thermolithotrophum DSM 11699]